MKTFLLPLVYSSLVLFAHAACPAGQCDCGSSCTCSGSINFGTGGMCCDGTCSGSSPSTGSSTQPPPPSPPPTRTGCSGGSYTADWDNSWPIERGKFTTTLYSSGEAYLYGGFDDQEIRDRDKGSGWNFFERNLEAVEGSGKYFYNVDAHYSYQDLKDEWSISIYPSTTCKDFVRGWFPGKAGDGITCETGVINMGRRPESFPVSEDGICFQLMCRDPANGVTCQPLKFSYQVLSELSECPSSSQCRNQCNSGMCIKTTGAHYGCGSGFFDGKRYECKCMDDVEPMCKYVPPPPLPPPPSPPPSPPSPPPVPTAASSAPAPAPAAEPTPPTSEKVLGTVFLSGYTKSSFGEDEKYRFANAIAKIVGVSPVNVTQVEYELRRNLEGVRVTYEISVADYAAVNAVKSALAKPSATFVYEMRSAGLDKVTSARATLCHRDISDPAGVAVVDCEPVSSDPDHAAVQYSSDPDVEPSSAAKVSMQNLVLIFGILHALAALILGV